MELGFNELKTRLTEADIESLVFLLCKGCTIPTRKRVRSMLTYSPRLIPNYGIMNRLSRDSMGWEYTAGQSYTDEIRTVRKIILTLK